jgi:hypothetical protein
MRSKQATKEGGLCINFLAHNFMTPILLCEYNFGQKGKENGNGEKIIES